MKKILAVSYRISSVKRQSFFLPKQSQNLNLVTCYILYDGSRSLGLFWKGKTHITAKLHMTDLMELAFSIRNKVLKFHSELK